MLVCGFPKCVEGGVLKISMTFFLLHTAYKTLSIIFDDSSKTNNTCSNLKVLMNVTSSPLTTHAPSLFAYVGFHAQWEKKKSVQFRRLRIWIRIPAHRPKTWKISSSQSEIRFCHPRTSSRDTVEIVHYVKTVCMCDATATVPICSPTATSSPCFFVLCGGKKKNTQNVAGGWRGGGPQVVLSCSSRPPLTQAARARLLPLC